MGRDDARWRFERRMVERQDWGGEGAIWTAE
jgi:hypothetical protein